MPVTVDTVRLVLEMDAATLRAAFDALIAAVWDEEIPDERPPVIVSTTFPHRGAAAMPTEAGTRRTLGPPRFAVVRQRSPPLPDPDTLRGELEKGATVMGPVLTRVSDQSTALRALRSYLDEVAGALGVGPEACTVDQDVPVSAYLALDTRLPTRPRHDLALVWDEEHGWAAATESRAGRDLTIVDHLGAGVLPEPRRVARFVRDLCAGAPARQPEPRRLRVAGDYNDLLDLLTL